MSSAASNAQAPDPLVERLQIALRRRFGSSAVVENVVAATLGGSNRTLLFDFVNGNERARWVLRQETYLREGSPFLPPEQQYPVIELAYRAGIPVPEPIFLFEPEDELGRGYVTSAVDGETLPKKILTDARFAQARGAFALDCGRILGRLHQVDTTSVTYLEESADSRDPVAAQYQRYEDYGEKHPALELGFRWLELNRPGNYERRLLHGDFRNGNLIVGPGGIRAVLDWECTHFGDPIEDLGWLCSRSWRFGVNNRPAGGIATRESLIAAYESNSDISVDRVVLRWWEIFALVRWAVLNIMQAHGHVTGARRSLAFAACGRNTCVIEYDLMMTLCGKYD